MTVARLTLIVLAIAGSLTACGDSPTGGNASASSEQDASPLPTHDLDSTGDALIVGTLDGRDGCFWIDTGGAGEVPLILPKGSTSTTDGSGELQLRIGEDVFLTGEKVAVGGDGSADREGCTSYDGRPFVVQGIESCETTDCFPSE